MELRALRQFLAVAHCGSIRQAAVVLGMAQPPLSHAIRKLEEELRVPLFARSSAGVTLTPAGEALQIEARVVLDQMNNLTSVVRAKAGLVDDVLKVGLLAGVLSGADMTERLIHSFAKTHPEIDTQLIGVDFQTHLDALIDGKVDVAFVRPPYDDDRIDVVEMGSEPRVVVVSNEHRFSTSQWVPQQDVLEERMAALAGPPGWRRFWLLEDMRGVSATLEGEPARNIDDLLATVIMKRVIAVVGEGVLQHHSMQGLHALRTDGLARSVIALAKRRGDRRTVVRTFLSHAAKLSGSLHEEGATRLAPALAA